MVRWLEDGRFHPHIHTSHPFSALSINLVVVSLWSMSKAIRFEIHRLTRVGINWFPYFYSTGTFVLAMDFMLV